MKQSTKLLSLILALVMAFSCVSVIGNAANLGKVNYDSIDDAKLTADQVATIILDTLDKNVLNSVAPIHLFGNNYLYFNSVDNVFATLYGLKDLLAVAGAALIPFAGELDMSPLGSGGNPYKRAVNGDLFMIKQLVAFIGNDANSNAFSKAAYGVEKGTKDGIDLGSFSNKLPANVSAILKDIPGHSVLKTYNVLLAGRPGYEDAKVNPAATPADVPAEANTLDKLFNEYFYSMATQPHWKAGSDWVDVPQGQTEAWSDLVVMPTLAAMGNKDKAAAKALIDINKNSLLQILDNIGQILIDDLIAPNLTHHWKRGLMYATNARFDELDIAAIETNYPEVYEAFGGVNAKNLKQSWNNFVYLDKMVKSNDGNWFFSDVVTVPSKTETDPVTKKPVDVKVRKFYKVDASNAYDTYNMINWDYEFLRSDETITDPANQFSFNYKEILAKYGTIAGSLNHIVHVIYEHCASKAVKDEFSEYLYGGWYDGANDDLFYLGEGGVEEHTYETIDDNILRMVKYAVANLLDDVLGAEFPFKDPSDPKKNAKPADVYTEIQYDDLETLLVKFGVPLFKLVMPHFILPENFKYTVENGMPESFNNGIALIQFGTLVLREFLADATPGINYDKYIFEEGSLNGTTGRTLVTVTTSTGDYDSEYWYNLGINMAMDLAYDYLNNVTNFEIATPAQDITADRWMGMLDKAIMWGADYIGDKDTSVILGLEPKTLESKGDALDKLNYVLNLVLPLGFVSDCQSADGTYDFDVKVVFQKMKDVTNGLSVLPVLACFGRNANSKSGNILMQPLVPAVLKLVNRIVPILLNRNNLVGLDPKFTSNADMTKNYTCSNVITQANLKRIIQELLSGINERVNATTNKGKILENVLPVVAKFIPGWGTEQEYAVPSIGLASTVTCDNGNTTYKNDKGEWPAGASEFEVYNNAKGIVRHYASPKVGEDKPYIVKYGADAFKIYDLATGKPLTQATFGTNEAGVFTPIKATSIGHGEHATAGIKISGLTKNVAARVDFTYTVVAVDGTEKTYTISKYIGINHHKNNYEKKSKEAAHGKAHVTAAFMESNIFIPISTPEASAKAIKGAWVGTANFNGDTVNSNTFLLSASPNKVDGITFGSVDKTFKGTAGGTLDEGNKYTFWLRNFDNYTSQPKSANGNNTTDVVVKGGGVDVATLTKSPNYKDGGKTQFNVTAKVTVDRGRFGGGYKEAVSNGKVTLVYYDDAARADLIKLVNAEQNANRLSASYTNTAAVNAYKEAMKTAVLLAYCRLDGETNYGTNDAYNTYPGALKNLKAAIKNLVACKENTDTAMDSLKIQLDASKAKRIDGQDYTDYKLYRHNRFYKLYSQAADLIELRNAAHKTIDSKYLPYGDNLGETAVENAINGYEYADYIRALYEPYKAEEVERAELNKAAAQANYINSASKVPVAEIDLKNADDRLIKKYDVAQTHYLDEEITSAENEVVINKELYTTRSYKIFETRLNEAKTAATSGKQSTIFDAKYELQCARNKLVLKGFEADYTELKGLMDQAEIALKHPELYTNGAKDWGCILAAYGVDSAKTNNVTLFYGTAKRVFDLTAYSYADQDKIDDAEYALKAALSKLKFKAADIKYAGVAPEDKVFVKADPDKDIKEVKASVTNLDLNALESVVKSKFTNNNVDVDAQYVKISANDVYGYTNPVNTYVGTNATVTIYEKVDSVDIPVKTIKIVVINDLNGDGVADALDCATSKLASTDKITVNGCFKFAADADKNDSINDLDYQAVVNASKGA